MPTLLERLSEAVMGPGIPNGTRTSQRIRQHAGGDWATAVEPMRHRYQTILTANANSPYIANAAANTIAQILNPNLDNAVVVAPNTTRTLTVVAGVPGESRIMENVIVNGVRQPARPVPNHRFAENANIAYILNYVDPPAPNPNPLAPHLNPLVDSIRTRAVPNQDNVDGLGAALRAIPPERFLAFRALSMGVPPSIIVRAINNRGATVSADTNQVIANLNVAIATTSGRSENDFSRLAGQGAPNANNNIIRTQIQEVVNDPNNLTRFMTAEQQALRTLLDGLPNAPAAPPPPPARVNNMPTVTLSNDTYRSITEITADIERAPNRHRLQTAALQARTQGAGQAAQVLLAEQRINQAEELRLLNQERDRTRIFWNRATLAQIDQVETLLRTIHNQYGHADTLRRNLPQAMAPRADQDTALTALDLGDIPQTFTTLGVTPNDPQMATNTPPARDPREVLQSMGVGAPVQTADATPVNPGSARRSSPTPPASTHSV